MAVRALLKRLDEVRRDIEVCCGFDLSVRP
jgi:hypothetical protein